MNNTKDATVQKDIVNSRKIAGARAIIYIPLFISLMFGLLLLYAISISGNKDVTGLTTFFNVLIAGGLFVSSLPIAAIGATIGMVMLNRIKRTDR